MAEAPRVFAVLMLIVALGLFGLFAGGRDESGAQPALETRDQPIVNGTVTVDRVQSGGIGWVAIHRDDNGSIGEIIGYTRVSIGQSRGVAVPVDAERATETLHAMLHRDLGVADTFEYPGADVRVIVEERVITSAFQVLEGVAVTPPAAIPGISATDQPIVNGTVAVARVAIQQQGWVTIHNDNNGQPGALLGAQPAQRGETVNVVVPINVDDVTPVLHAVLYTDGGSQGAIEIPGVDTPVTVDGQLVASAFQITGGVPEVLPASGDTVLLWGPGLVALGCALVWGLALIRGVRIEPF